MKPDGAWTEDQGAASEADLPIMVDLRLRLQASQEQLLAARTEARRLARELALAHRLLRSGTDNPTPGAARTAHPRPPGAARPNAPLSATLLTEPVTYHLDRCENHGASTALSGWAFRPAPEWDARATAVSLLFRHEATVFHAPARRVPRPDVAAHFAAQGPGLSGGARGLDGTGFACEILHASLPAGVDLEITLRLECAGLACEQPTGQILRL